ncbi:phosphoglucosamine mutase [Candidatus Kinetoplastidibacterium crithidiae]|uniref:Phosphoglucosamine mutase n=1 Tax=Candidatus Kinetoplastidibacterium crithidiae TCC036E TaxID=1208918 RepID=M1L3X5_9PROT|nr:phosphoglucosamine mutase [Candidatus Kinetoplastibacterium crithidii]AFZ83167.1 phosphoglucosamine mutase [Candidatus Kinetoplastibacterium crithidii (ex Angomonas deanei ATCC 30255)]AGF47443.1 phosphoglucosamine mutase [Candidatus Kinetoplastibacterium crithidii TCC036E]
MYKNKYFGTDGIRGLVGGSLINIEFAFRLGFAAGLVFADRYNNCNKAVIITRDTRSSSSMLESAIQTGFLASGVDVFIADSYPMPTSSASFLVKSLNVLAGVVVSASHNPYHYNGFKFFSHDGFKLSEEVEIEIERRIDECKLDISYANKFGQSRLLKTSVNQYIRFCQDSFPDNLSLRGLRIVVDAANGSAYKIAPTVFKNLGAEVYSIGVDPDGFNINDGVGSLSTELLSDTVVKNKADLGIALDGDSDRVKILDSKGTEFAGDELLYVIIKDRLLFNRVEGVVGTCMTNYGFELQMRKLGIGFDRANVGDRSVTEQLNKRGWLYGGENSGHIVCLDYHTTGDGIIAALQVLAAIVRSQENLSSILSDLHMYSQKIINIPWDTTLSWEDNNSLKSIFEVVKKELDGRGRILIRKSGTEPVLRVMVEAEQMVLVEESISKIISCI